jgi:uncharacterized membrane protein HdeD (DUF308 family)
MPLTLANSWWSLALRGLAAVLFGVLTFIAPGLSLFALVLCFGAYALTDGIFNLILALRGRKGSRPWGALIFEGVASIVVGALTFLWPGMTALGLVFFIGA